MARTRKKPNPEKGGYYVLLRVQDSRLWNGADWVNDFRVAKLYATAPSDDDARAETGIECSVVHVPARMKSVTTRERPAPRYLVVDRVQIAPNTRENPEAIIALLDYLLEVSRRQLALEDVGQTNCPGCGGGFGEKAAAEAVPYYARLLGANRDVTGGPDHCLQAYVFRCGGCGAEYVFGERGECIGPFQGAT